MMTYYNTTNEKGGQLNMFNAKSKHQDTIILAFFEKHHRKAISPSEVWVNCFAPDEVPITSIRRSITNLTKTGRLIKTEIKDTGLYGRPEYKWKLK